MQWDFGVVWRYLPDLAAGAGYTLLLTAVALVLGTGTGLALALLRLSGRRWLSIPAYLYIDFFRTTPPLVQIVWAYYALPVVLGLNLDSFSAASLALGLNTGAFFAEIFRGGILAVPKGQRDAARVLGLSSLQTLRLVIFPQAFKITLPALTVITMLTIKFTSFASVIAVLELTTRGYLISQATLAPLETFTVVAVIYFIMIYPISMVAARLERRLKGSERGATAVEVLTRPVIIAKTNKE